MTSSPIVGRFSIFILTVIAVACTSGCKRPTAASPEPFAAPATPAGDVTPPDDPNAVWLHIGSKASNNVEIGLLGWELYRQAILIAAREGLGLHTRDESLREFNGRRPARNTLFPAMSGSEIQLSRVYAPRLAPIWQAQVNWSQAAAGYDHVIENIESLSRTDFVEILRQQGWSGQPDAINAQGAALPDSEAMLAALDEFSQFAIVRQTHAAIAVDGESPQRLGVLVRGYANLGQLARYQWSLESQVFTARSLLYGQRMVATEPKSAWALWHRAYAYALAGLQGAALRDLAAADATKTGPPPGWAALLQPYCEYQTGRLTDLAAADSANTSLGMFLAFLTVENSTCQGAVMSLAQAAFKVNPHCLRLVDAMCDQTGPGMLNELTESAPQLFSQMLPLSLAKMPDLPKPVSQLLPQLTTPDQYAAQLPTLCKSLIDQGDTTNDTGEPSWGALGRMIQEIIFAHLERRANLIAVQWGVDASDFVNQARPLFADHPDRSIIEAYGVEHGNDPSQFALALDRVPADQFTFTSLPFYNLTRSMEGDSFDKTRDTFTNIWRNRDFTSFDIERAARMFADAKDAVILGYYQSLPIISPQSPLVLAARIHNDFTPESAAKIEAEHGDFPLIARALGTKYFELKQWADAERCFKRYIAVSPDYSGYESLARVYQQQNRDDQWLATLQEFLQQPAFGLEQVNVEVEIAEYYMRKGDYPSALPYADAAAGSGAAFGLACAAGAHAGSGDWDGAEQLIREEITHYSTSPYMWYAWCVRTGHGNRSAAAEAVRDYTAGRGDRANVDDLLEEICVDMGENDNDQALAVLRRRMSLKPGPYSAMHMAIIADAENDAAARDAALAEIDALKDQTLPLVALAGIIKNAIAAGPNAPPDPAAIEALLSKQKDSLQITAILYLTGRYLDHHGHPDEATAYFRRCAVHDDGRGVVDMILSNDQLKRRGMDPLAVFAAAHAPDPTWLEP